MHVEVDDRSRWARGLPFLVCGVVSVTVGGFAAAVTGPTGWDDGSWIAAFLVLVSGVGQGGLGVGQVFLATEVPTSRVIAIECTLWNVGALAVLAGTIIETPPLVSLGGIALLVALALLAKAARTPGQRDRRLRRAYQSLVLVLLISTPIGIALSWIRS